MGSTVWLVHLGILVVAISLSIETHSMDKH